MNTSRRKILQLLAGLPLLTPLGKIFAEAIKTELPGNGNFHYVYNDEAYRNEFFDFLVNVFHLYPQDQLDLEINLEVQRHDQDRSVYRAVQDKLGDIKPLLGDITYSLPALAAQKREMALQTTALLDTGRRYEGYLELGSTGRYIDALEEKLDIQGERFMVSAVAPTYSIVDMIDRGQIFQAGPFINLNDYRSAIPDRVPEQSLDLVTVYIGFHHCPVALRGEFLASIRRVMRPGAYLIVRDHNAHDEKMQRIVGLAHDVFNMGTNETWDYNAAELRHFYSLAFLDEMLREAGFKSNGRQLFQAGDPTLNALMVYQKA